MAEITLKQLAADLQISVDRLLSHTKELGYAYNPDSLLPTAEKKRIEEFLKSPDKVSVTRRSQSALTVSSSQGKARTINVEVRKTRTYVRKGATGGEEGNDKKPVDTLKPASPTPSIPLAAVEKKSSRPSPPLPSSPEVSEKPEAKKSGSDTLAKPESRTAAVEKSPAAPAKAATRTSDKSLGKTPENFAAPGLEQSRQETQASDKKAGILEEGAERSKERSPDTQERLTARPVERSSRSQGVYGAAERNSSVRAPESERRVYQNVTPSARLESGNQGEVRRRMPSTPPSRERPAGEGGERPRRLEVNRVGGNRTEAVPREGNRAETPREGYRPELGRDRDSLRPPRSPAGSDRPSRDSRADPRSSSRLGERQADSPRPVTERALRPTSDRPPQRTHDLRGPRPPAGTATRPPERTLDRPERSPGHEERPSQPARNEDSGGSFALKDKERRPAVRQKERSKTQQDEDRNKAAKKAKGEKRWEEVDPLLAKTVPLSDLEALEEVQSEKGSRRKKSQAKAKHAFAMPTTPQVREVEIYEGISVADLAQQMAVKAPEVIKTLFKMGVMATINHALDCDTAALVVEEMGHTVKLLNTQDVEEKLFAELKEVEKKYVSRPPVVTIMGHVDHGKTSLLDYIRRTKVAEGEAGGITQHVGAYHVTTPRGVITFLDTPGHAAFTAMRSRGATVTDIVVLVVAADDSVMPQTIEAIQHAKAAQVPIIVAINKMDKAEANPERVKQDLVKHEVVTEDFGGEAMAVPVSAKTGLGIDELLEAILLQAEVLELKAIANVPAQGHILEASLDKGRGPVATVLVQHGYLKKGDIVLSGTEYGRVRAMFDESGKAIEQAGPALPVVILGLSGAPVAGDVIQVVGDERQAREVAEFRQRRLREEKIAQSAPSGFDSVFEKMNSGEQAVLHVVIKADVQGSAEALRDSFIKVGNAQAQVKVMAASVGGINESDIHLAVTSAAVVIGFNVRADAGARRLAEEKGINIRYYSIIYDAIDDIKQVLSGLLAPETKEQIIGTAKVLSVFRSSKFGTVAGCLVVEGMVKSGNPIRVLRDNIVVHQGDLSSLRRFKDDVTEVRSGTECGIGLKNFNDVREGDMIEVFERITVQRSL
jgi:translation initiation factor IF-2